MDANIRRRFLLAEEKVPKALILLAIPSIIAMLTNAIYNFVDALFVGMLKNTAMIAAVTVSLPMVMIMSAIGQGIGIGAGSLISRQLGRKEDEQVKKTVYTAMIMVFAFSILGMVVLIPNLDQILPWFGATEDAMLYATRYAMWMIIGMASTILNMTINNMLRAEGDVKFPMIAIMIGAVLNIFLDPIFMFDWGFGLQLEGAAIATIVSQLISSVILLNRLLRTKTSIQWKPLEYNFSLPFAKEIFALGIALFFRQALVSFSMLFINNAAASIGTELVASIGLAMRTIMIVNFVLIGYAQGFQPFAGYNYGARRFDRVHDALSISIRWSTVFLVFSSLFMVLFSAQIMALFNAEPDVVYYGRRMFYAVSISLPFMGYYQMYMVLMQSLGKAKEAFFLSVARQGIFFIPMILILPRVFSYNGILAAQPAADLLTVALTFFFSVRLKKDIQI